MAYMSQETKRAKAPAIQAILKRYGLRGSLSVQHNTSLVLTIRSGKIDFIGDFNSRGYTDILGRFAPITTGHIQVNHYWYHEHFTGEAKQCLKELISIMNIGNHDNSEPQVDYFDVGWYISINIGAWNKPYINK